MSKILYNSLICILWKKKMSGNSGGIFKKLTEISGEISVTLKLIFSIALILSIIAGFVFAATYMRSNRFFSYEIFSVSNIWIFLLAGIYMVMTLLAAYGLLIYAIFICKSKDSQQKESQYDLDFDKIKANKREAYSEYNEKKLKNESYCEIRLLKLYLLYKVCELFFKVINWFFKFIFLLYKALRSEWLYVVLSIIYGIFIGIGIGCNMLLVTYVLFFILFLVLFLVLYFSNKEVKNRMGLMIAILVIMLLIYFITLLPLSDFHTKFYKEFLQSRGLASDHAEIYLKDKNESVRGKLIFDDGKYAYVEFNRTDSNCGGIGVACEQKLRKKVPSEDVSIFVLPEQ